MEGIIISDRVADIFDTTERFFLRGITYEVKYCNIRTRRFVGGIICDSYEARNDKFKLNQFDFNGDFDIVGIPRNKVGGKPTQIKIGKLINLIELPVIYSFNTYREVEINSAEYKSVYNYFIEFITKKVEALKVKLNFSISKNISEIYTMRTHCDAGRQMLNSCMNYESSNTCSEFSKAYDLVGDNLSVVYGTKEGELLYRALLWDVEVDGVSTKLLDRVYGDDVIIQQLMMWAKTAGYLYRNIGGKIMINDIEFNNKIIIPVEDPDEFMSYCEDFGTPYMDTLQYYSSDGFLSNKYEKYNLTECDGSAMGGGANRCDCCGDSIRIDDGHSTDNGTYCESCFYDSYTFCSDCGEVVELDDSYSTDNGTYCESCFYDSYTYCDDCGEVVELDDSYSTDNGTYCESCFNDSYTYCDDCGEVVELDDSYSTDNGTYCESCFNDSYTYCDDCGEVVELDDSYSTDNGTYCESCFNDSYTYCDDCGEVVELDASHSTDDGTYCESCFDLISADSTMG
jgi:formylmethanofuran dehydrogenase subunit E